MIVKLGLQFELNAQNVLIGLDDDGYPVAVVVRDCMGIEKDIDIRRRLGLPVTFAAPDYKVIGFDIDQTGYRIRHSFAFDFKLSCYVIDPLIRAADAMGVWPREDAVRDVRAHVKTWIEQLPADYFPAGDVWYRHANELLVSERQYIQVAAPLFR